MLAAARDRRGGAVVLAGEPGIGKSRLVTEAAARAFMLDMPALRGRASVASRLMPFRPLTEALNSLFRAAGPPTDPELIPYRPALSRLVPEWRTAPGPDGVGESLVVVAEALLRLLAAVGRDRGCVVALE